MEGKNLEQDSRWAESSSALGILSCSFMATVPLLWRCKTRFFCQLCPLQISDPEACDQMYESLVRIHTNFYKNKVRAVALATAPLSGECHLLLQHSWEC